MKDKYTLGNCLICKKMKALKNGICVICEKIFFSKELFDNFDEEKKNVD